MKARKDAAKKATAAAERLESAAGQAAADAEQSSITAEQKTAEASDLDERAERAMQDPGRKFAEARARILREQARVLRESQIAHLEVKGEGAFNPGEHRPAGGAHKLSLASYVLGEGDSPWKGWGANRSDFGARIVTHELAHALMTANPNAAKKFLGARWKGSSRALEEQRRQVMVKYQRRLTDLNNDPAWKERPERERKVEALRLADPFLHDLERKFKASYPGAPDFPTRFPGDMHAFLDENEYFAVALELYFHDPERFSRCFTAAEQEILQALLTLDGQDDLLPTRATRQK